MVPNVPFPTVDQVLEEAFKNNRVCPLPPYWNELWNMLPNRHRQGAGWSPSLPLILAAWHESSDPAKKSRFEEHIRWADTHGVLNETHQFIANLSEDRWHHGGE
jgi:hypothetical protein